MTDAAAFAKVTEEFILSHTPHLFSGFFRLQVHHKLTEEDVLLEMSRSSTSLAVIYKIQTLKNRMEEVRDEDSTKEELEHIFHLLVERNKLPMMPVSSSPPQCATPGTTERVAFLLELAVLALQVRHQKVAANCLKELKSAGEASVGQQIAMECVSCEMNLLRREAKMNGYSRASVEVRLKEVERLDRCLQTAVREGGPRAVQAVCAAQWGICLPLLQHNLRKSIKTPLRHVADVLEDMQSMLLQTRCQIHSELAVLEEEEGFLEASLTHLQKAMQLDDGTLQERLASALHLLQLRTVQHPPSQTEDEAAVLIQQVKDVKPQHSADVRPVLVAAGLLLGSDDFRMVLDADGKPKNSLGSGPEAQHHRLEEHLDRPGDHSSSMKRLKLWASLVKTARKQEVWDVCRAACRLCLQYDDGTRRGPASDKCKCSEDQNCVDCCHGDKGSQTDRTDFLRLLAEICFISAEATIQKLRTEEGCVNGPAAPTATLDARVSEDDPQQAVYRDSTSSFLRAAELGAEIKELWLVENAAVYLWNHSKHLLAAGDHRHLLPAFGALVEIIRRTESYGNRVLFVLLCDAAARGLIQPTSRPDQGGPAPSEDKDRNRKGMDKPASISRDSLEPPALQDVRRAQELCDLALLVSGSSGPGAPVPIAARKRVLSTWVQTKQLQQQQIGSKMETTEEGEDDDQSVMAHVLIGLEMLECNRDPWPLEFSVPSLSSLVSRASECSWTDALVELQVWAHLAASCHHAEDHSLVLSCTHRALQLEDAAVRSLKTAPYRFYGLTAVNELLSSVSCLRGLSLVHGGCGDLHSYREALKFLHSSVRYAEKAGSRALCATGARHYWNACLPFTHTPEERLLLQGPLENILTALVHTNRKPAQVQTNTLLTLTTLSTVRHTVMDEEDLTLRLALYNVLLLILADKEEWKRALHLLGQAIRDMPSPPHTLPLMKQQILLKAQLGQSVLVDMEEFEGDQCCSSLWRQAALCSGHTAQQLACYQNSIDCLVSVETRWEKISLLLEFGEWLYLHNFPRRDAQCQIQWAIDLLLHEDTESGNEAETGSGSVREAVGGVTSVSGLRGVRQLDVLVRAHTLLAVVCGRASPEHQRNLLRAHGFVLHMWKVSVAVCFDISSEMDKQQQSQSPPSAGSKKEKGKGKKSKETPPAEERPKPTVLHQTPPSTLRDWAQYVCPEMNRHIFRTTSSPHCINTHTLPTQTQSLFYLDMLQKELRSVTLEHLTLPIMHLAETIAHDLLERRSLSDFYRLSIVRTCCLLGSGAQSPYQEQLLALSGIQEEEQMECHKRILSVQERRRLYEPVSQKAKAGQKAGPWQRGCVKVCVPDLWLNKAAVCLSLDLLQPARLLLAEAHLVAQELGDHKATARSLLHLSRLACKERKFNQALKLLDKSQDLGGDEDFWYQLTLTRVTAVTGRRDHDAPAQVDQIIIRGCAALKLLLDQHVNREAEITSFITSLEMRGAVECVRALRTGGPGGVQRLKTACETLQRCATTFTALRSTEQAAEAHLECAQGLRVLAGNTTIPEDKQHLLLDGFSQLQTAVTKQEHLVLRGHRLLLPQEGSGGLSLAAERRLLHLRLSLVEFCLSMLEQRCAEKTGKALDREQKSSAEIILEEFIRGTPEPNSVEEEWLSVSATLGQVVTSQLAAVTSQSTDSVEVKGRCLGLMGKYLRLLAVQEDPLHPRSLWNTSRKTPDDPEAVSMEDSDSITDGGSSREAPRSASANNAELQISGVSQQLLTQARTALSETISLCLQNQLPPPILRDASLNALECHGQVDPALAGHYLALFQTCCSISTMSEVLDSSCGDAAVSQLSALSSLHPALLAPQEESPKVLLGVAEDSLQGCSEVFSHLTIDPNHLNILAELPPPLTILLLQHSEDWSQLYGGVYETPSSPNTNGMTTQVSGSLVCSQVAKTPVCPPALGALQRKIQAFLRDPRQSKAGGRLEDPGGQQGLPCEAEAEETRLVCFREIVQDMEDYLDPLLTQFDLSCLRPQEASEDPDETQSKEDGATADPVPVVPEGYVVLLADRKLLELPLEALSVLQAEGVTSVSRDFSVQLLHRRLQREEPLKAVESNNKKETKGGKGGKVKADESPAIKAFPVSQTPSNTFPVETRNLRLITDPLDGGKHEGNEVGASLKEIFHRHHLPQDVTASSLWEMEQQLSTCSSFVYLRRERFLEHIPAAKLAALDLPGCCLAVLFESDQSDSSVLHRSPPDMTSSGGQLTVGRSLQTALLLSLHGVGGVVLNQWSSSRHQNTHNMDNVLHNLLGVRQTSGRAVHALRTGSAPDVSASDGPEVFKRTLEPSAFNCILYGLPNFIFT
ncbi:cilia- and flagella-associated protein 46 isoform X2 [Antennarius striatus]|uniref:cilia- and flagella-associated protein 46 isoform X2 n=1 Tax=Antennarius striatus TaxID=241820 RepID=UPI0035B1BF9E